MKDNIQLDCELISSKFPTEVPKLATEGRVHADTPNVDDVRPVTQDVLKGTDDDPKDSEPDILRVESGVPRTPDDLSELTELTASHVSTFILQ